MLKIGERKVMVEDIYGGSYPVEINYKVSRRTPVWWWRPSVALKYHINNMVSGYVDIT